MAFNKAKALQGTEKLAGQNKLSAAIKRYEEILKKDPLNPNLINTLGDLYVRDKNVPKAMGYSNRLGDTYVEEGFYRKGIAYEQAADVQAALDSFTEVCSHNIDYRDVAERIRLL